MTHRGELYGDSPQSGGAPAIPAATVVLLRDAGELQVLLLHKASQIAFGGMWVFPGGRIDAEDYPDDGDLDTAARNAPVRETAEQAGLVVRPEAFVWFSHWTAPPRAPKRCATWFFAAPAEESSVTIDGSDDGVRVAMWGGDAGYAGADADAPGTRHRLVMSPGGFSFEHTPGADAANDPS